MLAAYVMLATNRQKETWGMKITQPDGAKTVTPEYCGIACCMEEKYRHTSIASPTEIEAIVGGVQVTFSVKDVNYFSVTTHMNNLVLIVLPKKHGWCHQISHQTS